MADKIDLIVTQDALKALNDLIKNLELADAQLQASTASALKMSKAVNTISSPSAFNDFVANQKKANDGMIEQSKNVDKLAAATKRLEFAMSEEGQQLAAINAEIQKQNQLNKQNLDLSAQLDASITKGVKSKNDAIAQNKLLRQSVAQLDVTTQAGKDTLAKYNAMIDKNTEFIRENSDAFTKQKMNVGNYANSIMDALSKTSLLNGQLGGVVRNAIGFVQSSKQVVGELNNINSAVTTTVKNFIGFGNASKAATAGLETMTPLVQVNNAALEETVVATEAATVATEGFVVAEEGAAVATGILDVALGILLAPITLLIAAFGALFFIFKDFAPLINPIKDSFKALGAVWEVLKHDVIDLATGARSLKEVFSTLFSDLSNASSASDKLSESMRSINKEADILAVKSAQYKTQVQDLILQSKDRTKTEKERIDLINQAQAIEEKNYQANSDLNKKKIENAKKDLLMGQKITADMRKSLDNDDFAAIRSWQKMKGLDAEKVKALQQLYIDQEGLNQEHVQIMEKAQNRENLLADKAEQDRSKRIQKAQQDRNDAAKKQEEQLRLHYQRIISDLERQREQIKDISEVKDTTLEDRIFLEQAAAYKELQIAKTIHDEEIRLAKDSNDAKVIADNKFATAQENILSESLKKQSEITDKFNDEQAKKNKDWYAKNPPIGLIDTEEAEKARDELKKTLDETSKFTQSFAIDFVNKSGFKDTFKLLSEGTKQFGDDWVATAELIGESAQEMFSFISKLSTTNFNNEKERLQKQRDISIAYAGDSAAAKEKIDKEYNKKLAELNAKEAKSKQEQAIFNIIIDTAQAIMATLGEGGAFALPVAIGLGALGAAQLALVMAQQIPQYAEGGTHTGGLALINDAEGNNYIETVITPDGKARQYKSRNTIVDLPKGTEILTPEQWDEQLKLMLMSKGIEMRNQNKSAMDYDKFDEIMGKHLSGRSTQHIVFDRNGFSQYIESNGNITRESDVRATGRGKRF